MDDLTRVANDNIHDNRLCPRSSRCSVCGAHSFAGMTLCAFRCPGVFVNHPVEVEYFEVEDELIVFPDTGIPFSVSACTGEANDSWVYRAGGTSLVYFNTMSSAKHFEDAIRQLTS